MNDIHGFSIFTPETYKARIMQGLNVAAPDAFFEKVTASTKDFTHALLEKMSKSHLLYDGGEKVMKEFPLPIDYTLKPVTIDGRVVDMILTNAKGTLNVSQGLLAHTFGPTFGFHLDRRTVQNKDGSTHQVPYLMVSGSSRRFTRTLQRFDAYLRGVPDTYGYPSASAPMPQMQYPITDYYENAPKREQEAVAQKKPTFYLGL
jgi:hypothetical protein